ncbi:hypothetical protein RM572_21760 [Streptomyces sp. DSM 42041]|uniref:Mucin-2 n=1 Tax=Streptomyces hazeniae TaxID=3075538 RepID=A0ABU2NWM8_9ACTN|nr:hypothetical protein [Streptomyces sp. DSM 42041]MDT0381388.1 hypothetical protein [Streptomyces sp. DSM 42041]
MAWFLVDDKSHSHPKFLAASNAAAGLWMKCGTWVAEHLTDGTVPGPVVKMLKGTPAQARALVDAGLWHGHGHDCDRCPQPAKGDYHMHDYARPGHGNLPRAEVERRRAREAEKKQRQRGGQGPTPPPGPGLFDGPPPAAGGRAARPQAAPIPAGWRPSEDDVAAAQLARVDAGREQLNPAQLDQVTGKFVARMREDGRTAAEWGGRWRQWAEHERTNAPGGAVVPFPGAQQTRGQQQRAAIEQARRQQQGGVG